MEESEQNANNVYKFYPPSEYSIDALLNHYFWFSKREYLNDPFDLGNFRKGRVVLNMLFLHQIMHAFRNVTEVDESQVLSKMSEYASCSFTTDALNKQMWAYYAKDYSGWCLGFRRGEVSVKQESILSPAIYVDDNCIPIQPVDVGLYGSDKFDNIVRRVLCVKHESWQHEKEERLIIKMKSETNGASRNWGSFLLREIIVGNKIATPYKNIILKFADLHHIPVYEITTKNIVDFQLSTKRIG